MRGIALVCAWGLLTVASAGEPVTFESLLRETYDLSRLPIARDFSLEQHSSYDRSGGNADFGCYLVEEGDRYVMAEMKGPGAIVRLWSANANIGSGRLKVFLDGASGPALDALFADLFHGKHPSFPEALSRESSGGWISYVPIPYAKSCRVEFVTADQKAAKKLYYQVTYRTYPANTRVKTWTPVPDVAESKALGLASNAWLKRYDVASADQEIEIEPRQRKEIFKADGAGVIRQVILSVPEAEMAERRKLLLRGGWDGEKESSVLLPLADLFGSVWTSNDWQSAVLQRSGDSCCCRWPMPFASKASLAIENLNARPMRVKFRVVSEKLSALPDKMLRFHAQWKRITSVKDQPFTILDTKGTGHYAGVIMNMQGRGGLGFLEGDEMSYPDCEPDPADLAKGRTINGTGCEDYFNCGWYFGKGPVDLPAHGCLYKSDPESRITAYRFNYSDVVPFQKSLLYTLEHGGRNDAPGADYAGVTFWYQDEPHGKFGLDTQPAELGLKILAPPPPPPPRKTFRQAGGIEGESLLDSAVVSEGAPDPVRQGMANFRGEWSNDAQLWWRATRAGQTLTLTLNVPLAGRYNIGAWFTRAIDYGMFELAINDKPVGKTLDLFHDGVDRTTRIDYGPVELVEGDNTLKVTVVGKHPEATSYMFGLDVLLLDLLR